MEICPNGGFAVSFSQQVLEPQGGGDDSVLNSVCLQCSTDGEVCSKKGYWGSWSNSSTSEAGFNGADLSIEPETSVQTMSLKDSQNWNLVSITENNVA